MMSRTLVVAIGFSIVSRALHGDVLATFDMPLSVGVVSDIPAAALDIELYYLDASARDKIPGSTIFDRLLATPRDVNSVFTADATKDANFTKFAELLTNGTEEVIWRGANVTTDVHGGSRGVGILVWEGSDTPGFAGNPLSLNGIDLWGYDIEEIQLRLNQLSLDYDGGAVHYSLDGTVHVVGDRNLLPGDADGNGVVEFRDFIILVGNYGSPGRWIDGDFNLDGHVDLSDFLALTLNYDRVGRTAASVTSIPEPATQTLLLALTLSGVCWSRRRRSYRVSPTL